MDTIRRTVYKTVSWRVFATLITGLITWLLTGKLALAATIGLADTLVKLFTYFLHERLWGRLPFGRPQDPEYEI